ncbi:unnamed protein product [marine sediment metagenome]|uniref:Uncharacterized protein n=1 Tax=marine sediment metagenome TaxID=412755 RepID=X1HM19_9ZZZZ
MSGLRERLRAQGIGEGQYEFKLVIMRPGLNSHHIIRKEILEFTHKINDTIYEVDPTTIYIWKPKLRRRLGWKLKRIKNGFMAIYREGQPKAIEYKSPKVTPNLIKVIYTSGALTKALKDEFKEGMNVKTLFMIFMVLAVGLVLYLALTGQLKLGV